MKTPPHQETQGRSYFGWAKWVMVLCGLFCLSLLAQVWSYAVPLFDDFCFAAGNAAGELTQIKSIRGLFTIVTWDYTHWSGRWLSRTLEVVLMTATPRFVELYPWHLWVVVLVLTMAVIVFFASSMGSLGLRLAAVFVLLFASSCPNPADGTNWVTGLIENQLGISLAMLVWGVASSKWMDGDRWGKLLLLAVIGFCACGIHELTALFFCIALAVRCALALRSQDPRRRIWYVLFSAAILGTLVVVLAPGNRVRASIMFPEHASLAAWISVTARQVFVYLKGWLLSDVRLWAAAVVVMTNRRLSAIFSMRREDRLAALTGWILIVAAGFAFPSITTGQEMAGRTTNQIFWVFSLGWILNAAIWGQAAIDYFEISRPFLRIVGSVALVVFSLSAALEGNARIASRELRNGQIPAWHEEHMRRFALLRGGGSSVHLPALTTKPTLMPRAKDSLDPSYAQNLCLELFFHVPAVSADPN